MLFDNMTNINIWRIDLQILYQPFSTSNQLQFDYDAVLGLPSYFNFTLKLEPASSIYIYCMCSVHFLKSSTNNPNPKHPSQLLLTSKHNE